MIVSCVAPAAISARFASLPLSTQRKLWDSLGAPDVHLFNEVCAAVLSGDTPETFQAAMKRLPVRLVLEAPLGGGAEGGAAEARGREGVVSGGVAITRPVPIYRPNNSISDRCTAAPLPQQELLLLGDFLELALPSAPRHVDL